MTGMKFYHIHRSNEKNNLWRPNNKIVVNENSLTGMSSMFKNFSQSIMTCTPQGMEKMLLSEVLRDRICTFQSQGYLNGVQLMDIMNLLGYAMTLSDMALIFKREQALELYRQNFCPNLPSRLHSFYLCDKESLEYWMDTLKGDSKHVFEVEVSGNIFKTNEQLLPDEILSYEETYKDAKRYWEPVITPDISDKNEYLVQGEINVLKRVK